MNLRPKMCVCPSLGVSKREYKEFKYLHDKSGFRWDHKHDIVTADKSRCELLLRGTVHLSANTLTHYANSAIAGQTRAAEVEAHFLSMVQTDRDDVWRQSWQLARKAAALASSLQQRISAIVVTNLYTLQAVQHLRLALKIPP